MWQVQLMYVVELERERQRELERRRRLIDAVLERSRRPRSWRVAAARLAELGRGAIAAGRAVIALVGTGQDRPRFGAHHS